MAKAVVRRLGSPGEGENAPPRWCEEARRSDSTISVWFSLREVQAVAEAVARHQGSPREGEIAVRTTVNRLVVVSTQFVMCGFARRSSLWPVQWPHI